MVVFFREDGSLEEAAENLDKILSMGHVNLYMFQGGTNFGFMNGANYADCLTPDKHVFYGSSFQGLRDRPVGGGQGDCDTLCPHQVPQPAQIGPVK